jgi:DNA-binding FadR family transcriptional regulator
VNFDVVDGNRNRESILCVKSLVAIGLLETRPGIGTFVVDSQPGLLRDPNATAGQAELQNLLEFRRIVEPESAALAAKRRQ